MLVVEIADSSLNNDRKTRSALYAAAGISEYWIVNLVNSQLEVQRDPSGGGYRCITILTPDEEVTPLNATGSIPVRDFMP